MQTIVVQTHMEIKLEARFSSHESSRKVTEIPKVIISQVDIAQPLRLLKILARNLGYPPARLQKETLKQLAQAILDHLPDEHLPLELEPLETKERPRETQRKSKGAKEINRKRVANKKKRVG
jgi:hypothetical protein